MGSRCGRKLGCVRNGVLEVKGEAFEAIVGVRLSPELGVEGLFDEFEEFFGAEDDILRAVKELGIMIIQY